MNTAVPCALCQTTGGHMKANRHRAARLRLEKYGISGVACWSCYNTVKYRATHWLDPLTGDRLPDAPPRPVRPRKSGLQCHQWKGGRSITSHGYVSVIVGRDHHLANSLGRAYEHRLVAEQKLGRRLTKGEHVHHINENRQDNRPENIEVLTVAEHRARHRKHRGRRLPSEPNVEIACECGCGEVLLKYDKQGRPRRFVPQHACKAATAAKTVRYRRTHGLDPATGDRATGPRHLATPKETPMEPTIPTELWMLWNDGDDEDDVAPGWVTGNDADMDASAFIVCFDGIEAARFASFLNGEHDFNCRPVRVK